MNVVDKYFSHRENELLQVGLKYVQELIVTLDHFLIHINELIWLVFNKSQQIVLLLSWYFGLFNFGNWWLSDYFVIRHQMFVFFVLYFGCLSLWSSSMIGICIDCWGLHLNWWLEWNFFLQNWFLLTWFSFCPWELILKRKSWPL